MQDESDDDLIAATASGDEEAFNRLVRRHDACGPAVLVNGRIAWHDGAFADGFGDQRGYGKVLRAIA